MFSSHSPTALAACNCTCGRDNCGTTTPNAGTPRKPLINVGVSLDTLLGLGEHPGFLHGFGAIDADLARLLATDGRWKLIADAAEKYGTEFGQNPMSYRLTAELERWIRAQDGTCRFPGCTVPAQLTDIDHGEPFDHEIPRTAEIRARGVGRRRVLHRPGRARAALTAAPSRPGMAYGHDSGTVQVFQSRDT
ncbi:hypothetical protein [Antrihabitans cavernicola]|uniref:hypothetical protein n=1 Tax=Antrihabitans cavernicola TaxID=2495913 RepID=UPI001659C2EC|nr:hypothetical protein [Spelaeibacter cavernicola]